MDNIQAAFDKIQAEQTLKETTMTSLSRRKIRRTQAARRLVPAVLCLCLLLGSVWIYQTPVAQISVEINPLVYLTVNRFGRVIWTEGGNEDGEVLLENLQLRHLSGTRAVERIMDTPMVAELIAEGEILSVGVIGEAGDQTRKLLSEIEICVGAAGDNECYYATPEEQQQAREKGLSCGKYRKLKRLQELEADVTAEDVQDMTMRQLHRHIAQLEESDETTQSHGQHHGNGAGEGMGNGNRHGHGKE